eukprot:symbB.v1.2.019725.t1/scaffold1625.1/size152758/8
MSRKAAAKGQSFILESENCSGGVPGLATVPSSTAMSRRICRSCTGNTHGVTSTMPAIGWHARSSAQCIGVAAVLWGFTALLVLAALLCCTTVGFKMGEQRASYRHRELGSRRMDSNTSGNSSKTDCKSSRMQSRTTSITQTTVV